MKTLLSKPEILLLKDMISDRQKFNVIFLEKATWEDDQNLEKHKNHFDQEAELLEIISLKLENKECEIMRCGSETSASVMVKDSADNKIMICETCAEVLGINEGERLPKNLVNIDLYYFDSKI